MNSARDTPKSCPLRVGCPIRRSRDQRSLASPPGFSQRAASFIASQCQGIHQMPLFRARSQGTPAPRDDPRITRTASRPPENRRAQGQAPPSLDRGATPPAAARMKTLLRTAPRTGSHPTGQQPYRTASHAAARPPRSHSQIRFTLQSTPAPEPRPPARDMPARPPQNRNQTWSSPNVGAQINELRSYRVEPGLRFLRLSILARVEVNGIEPMTSCLQSRRSPN